MLSFLKDKNIIKSNKILGVHCYLQSNGDLLFYYILISRDKGKLNIEKHAVFQGEIEQLATEVPTNIPVYLSVDGKGILTKKVTIDLTKSLIHQAIPNASEDEFIVQQFKGVDNHVFISIVRKNFLDEFLDRFAQQKFSVIGLTIGPLKAINVLKLFEDLPTNLSIGVYQVTCDIDREQIIDFSKENEKQSEVSYKIGDQDLPSVYLLPYYHALTYYVPDTNELQYPVIVKQFEEYTSKRAFSFAGWSALIILFLVLLVNMMFFTRFSDEKQKLESRVAGNKELLNNLKNLKEELDWKEKFLGQAGILKIKRMSYYADQIAITLPEAITLEKLDIHPVVNKIRKEKEIEIQPDKMIIEGVARNSQVLNSWIHVLKEKSWIEDVAVINYSKDENSNPGIFTIEMKISRKNKN